MGKVSIQRGTAQQVWRARYNKSLSDSASASDGVSVSVESGSGGSFPSEFSTSRSLITNNPGALLGGDDWQSYADSSEVCGEFHHEGGWGTTPCGCGTVALVNDGAFVQVPQGQHNDGSTNCLPNEVRYTSSFTDAPNHRVWARITHLCESGYESNTFWKFLWLGAEGGVATRHLALASSGGFTVDFDTFGGLESNLPGAPSGSDANYMGKPNSMITDLEWWEYIYCIEWLTSPVRYRVRGWARPLTSDNGQTISATVPGSPGDYVRKVGLISTDDPPNNPISKPGDYTLDQIWLGMTRNDPTSSGQTNFFRWGPWEVLDKDVISDPYGLGDDMLT